jgi:hypothetical protein
MGIAETAVLITAALGGWIAGMLLRDVHLSFIGSITGGWHEAMMIIMMP